MQDDLEEVRRDVIGRLSQAANDRKSAMHTPVFATADADTRILVLRAFDDEQWTLRFHTDSRSPKVSVIESDPAVSVLFYDREEKVQIRCRGVARIERSSVAADTAWQQSDNYARRCYLGSGPSVLSDEPTSGLPEWIEGEKPTDEQLAPARENFAVLLVEIIEADWYHLAHDGHRRALVKPGGEAHWLTP
ncbi:pyridoxamine 5'-phosphate oxidase family protein [Qipengyuania atrilutea]|uniref:Pyridoxamine 5'-phosphate oxidase family protein n=1 Tax=Qipengyuania atrilutea TaxID=2744473 RepID=A0A850H4L7_9SPHN|nr:pyridoxamine 5'-phosphate oxidase family protein [Actirhodobacter atriluteus]NVD45560.1 pyridoxamine 5'-phosphate oxidase family protein [Actirhodobacter atriluteus]